MQTINKVKSYKHVNSEKINIILYTINNVNFLYFSGALWFNSHKLVTEEN